MSDGRERPLTIAVSANSAWNIVNYRGELIRALADAGHRVHVLAPDGPDRERVEALGARFEPLAMSPRGTSPTKDLALLFGFVRLFRKIRPDVFLGFTAKPNIYGALAGRLSGVAIINNISGLGSTFVRQGPVTQIVKRLYRAALAGSSTVFFQNPDDRALFGELGLVDLRKAALLPGSGVDLAYFTPAKRAGKASPFTFLLASRMLWDKGVAEYVEAARRLGSPKVRFQILGLIEPPAAAAVPIETLRAWQDEGIIDYLGSARDVREHIARADCVVLPSFYREGVPKILLEASAMAVPVITTDAPGCREAIDDEKTGFLCAPRSAESLVAAMTRLLALPAAERTRMGKAARAKMEKQFSAEIVHRAYFDAVRRATG